MKRFYLMIVLLIFTGCFADTDFDQPEVVSVSPDHNSTLVPSDSRIIIDFSKAMDTVKTNNEFSLSSPAGGIEGTYSWSGGGTRLTFTPRNGLPSEKITVRIKKGAEDTEGNDLKNEFVSVFYINGENSSPYVISYNPAANSIGNTPGTPVVITFSEPVKLNSIFSGITISPSIQGYYTWDGGPTDSTVITFTPIYGFSYGVTYTVSINDSILDVSGNRLRDTFSFGFTTGDDFIKPEVSVSQDNSPPLVFDESAVTHGAEKNRRLILRFSEIINTDNLRNGVTISPSSVIYISSEISGGATTAYINFSENLQPDTAYTLRISTGIKDMQENPLIKEYRFVFVTDGPDSLPPYVSEIGDSDPVKPRWLKGDIEMLLLQSLPLDPLLYPDVAVDFNREINPNTLSIHAENAAGTGGTPIIINIDWTDGPWVKFTRLKFGLYKVQSGNIYRIVIKGGKNGLKDMAGNYMKSDFVQMVQF